MIALDSNAMTYWIDCMNSSAVDPTDPEKIALVRIFLWMPNEACFRYTPTVNCEFGAITNRAKLDDHRSWAMTHVSCLRPLPDPATLNARTAELMLHHRGEADCRIVAECELMGVISLLTCDTSLLKNLKSRTIVKVCLPSEYWRLMAIPKGAQPVRIPHKTNPLAMRSWWHW